MTRFLLQSWTNQNLLEYTRVRNQQGFTLIELLLAISVGLILLGIATINLAGVRNTTSVATAEESLLADIKHQQIQAMNSSQGSTQFGVHFNTPPDNTYILFQGTSFDHATKTSPVVVDDSIHFSGPDIVFSRISGETSPTTVTIISTVSSAQKTLQLNNFGVATGE